MHMGQTLALKIPFGDSLFLPPYSDDLCIATTARGPRDTFVEVASARSGDTKPPAELVFRLWLGTICTSPMLDTPSSSALWSVPSIIGKGTPYAEDTLQ